MERSEREEGFRAGQLDQRLANVEQHLKIVNGSIADTARELHEVSDGFNQLVAKLEERDKQLAVALALRENQAGTSLSVWQLRLGAAGIVMAVLSPVLIFLFK